MSRRWSWLILGLAAMVLLTVMGWVTVQLVALEASQLQAQRKAELEEQVRLALWRLDSTIPPLLSEELARVRLSADGQQGVQRPAFVQARFVVESGGEARWLDLEGVDVAPNLFAELARRLEDPPRLQLAAVVEPTPSSAPSSLGLASQQVRNAAEWSKRQSSTIAVYDNPAANSIDALLGSPPDPVQARRDGEGEAASPWSYGAVRPLWIDQQLVVARSVRRGEQVEIQGSLIDWSVWSDQLTDGIEDLLPEADLVAAPNPRSFDVARLLTSVPVALTPGPALPIESSWSPIGWSLIIGWTFVLLALAGLAGLMAASLSLSDRRAAFVSAVTHELRTPLTTFRMYTEMLSEGMVEPAKTTRYLQTLRREADRLGNLVENVLAYARIESRAGEAAQIEPVTVADLLDRFTERLQDRVATAGMGLEVEIGPEAADEVVRTDPTAVEQILFNLIDNACKYAAGADRPPLRLCVSARDRRIRFTVRDHGPGIAPADRRRIFEPFSKARADESGTVPGAGLGLALSRRQARTLGGELRLLEGETGATFELSLPIQR